MFQSSEEALEKIDRVNKSITQGTNNRRENILEEFEKYYPEETDDSLIEDLTYLGMNRELGDTTHGFRNSGKPKQNIGELDYEFMDEDTAPRTPGEPKHGLHYDMGKPRIHEQTHLEMSLRV